MAGCVQARFRTPSHSAHALYFSTCFMINRALPQPPILRYHTGSHRPRVWPKQRATSCSSSLLHSDHISSESRLCHVTSRLSRTTNAIIGAVTTNFSARVSGPCRVVLREGARCFPSFSLFEVGINGCNDLHPLWVVSSLNESLSFVYSL
jgi:hypothetical protein